MRPTDSTPHRYTVRLSSPLLAVSPSRQFDHRQQAERWAALHRRRGWPVVEVIETAAPAPAPPGKPPYDATPAHACDAPSQRHQTAADALRWAAEQASAHKVGYAVYRLDGSRWAKLADVPAR